VPDEFAKIELVCIDERHLKIGHEVRDGEGHLTIAVVLAYTVAQPAEAQRPA
jgi:hypothetical protein